MDLQNDYRVQQERPARHRSVPERQGVPQPRENIICVQKQSFAKEFIEVLESIAGRYFGVFAVRWWLQWAEQCLGTV